MRLTFDRGTVVLTKDGESLDLTTIPGVLWDARVGVHRIPPYRCSAAAAELRTKGVRVTDETASYVRAPDAAFSGPALRDYQDTALQLWNAAGCRGVIVLPTGSGKTSVAVGAMARSRLPTLCLVPTRVLLHQWRATLAEHYGGAIGVLGDGLRTIEPIMVATFESAFRAMERIGNRFGLLVVDEVHHFGNSIRDEALEMCIAPTGLGLTATPPANEAAARLVDLVGPVVYRLGVADLAGGFLSSYDIVPVEIELNIDERATYEESLATFRRAHRPFLAINPGASWVDFVRAASQTDNGRRALAAWRRSKAILAFPSGKRRALSGLLARHRDARVLVFTGDNETAYSISREHLIMPLTCDIGAAERMETIARFRDGTLRALVSAQVLNEGFDVPDAEIGAVVFLVDVTLSGAARAQTSKTFVFGCTGRRRRTGRGSMSMNAAPPGQQIRTKGSSHFLGVLAFCAVLSALSAACGGSSDSASGTGGGSGGVSTGTGAGSGGVSAGGASGTGGTTGVAGAAGTGGVGGNTTGSGGAANTGGTTGAGGGSGNGGMAGSGGGAGPGAGGSSGVLAATPPMGWNSWNAFACNIDEAHIKAAADALVTSGMKDAGYQYVCVDDCWMNGRDAAGNIQWDTTKFPSGMTSLASYVHGKGLKFGIYSAPNTGTCQGLYGSPAMPSVFVGSLGHETQDAKSYASWGVDFLKYDDCGGALGGFAVMRDALRATGRPIVYSINPFNGNTCDPTGAHTSTCGLDLLGIANMWRIGADIKATWGDITRLIDIDTTLSPYAGAGHWNDPDMLEVGNTGLSDTEGRTHFSMWAMFSAPLIAGNDLGSMSATTKATLTNTEVIAVDQDPLGQQGRLAASPGTNLQVWSKTLSGTNVRAVALLNRGAGTASITVQWSALGIPTGAATVRDLWSHTDLGSFSGSYTASSIPSHGVVMLKVTSTP